MLSRGKKKNKTPLIPPKQQQLTLLDLLTWQALFLVFTLIISFNPYNHFMRSNTVMLFYRGGTKAEKD